MKLKADGIGTICGRLHVGTAEKIPPSELVDTTGAGDAFIGAVLYGIIFTMKPHLTRYCSIWFFIYNAYIYSHMNPPSLSLRILVRIVNHCNVAVESRAP